MITGNANKHFAFKLILNSELLQNNTCNSAMSITINPVIKEIITEVIIYQVIVLFCHSAGG